jgi:hypothetical protein
MHLKQGKFEQNKIWFYFKQVVLLFGKFILERKEAKELSSRTILKHEIEFFIILKALLQLDKKGMVQLAQDVFFGHDILLLVLLEDVLLL